MLRLVIPATLIFATCANPRNTVAQPLPSLSPTAKTVANETTDSVRQNPDDISGLKTSVEFEIIADGLGAGLDAHRWSESLQKLGTTVRIRSRKFDDELGVKERVQGTLRWVIATGELRSGKLTFADRDFNLRQTKELKEWVDELKLYGSQGAPEGKPLWGLTRDQFNKVFTSLSPPVAVQIDGLPLQDAIRQLGLPDDLPVRFHSQADKHRRTSRSADTVRQQVLGISVGSALAIVLIDQGLGYRPLRTPAGRFELVVEPLANLEQPWPVGWDPPAEASRGKMLPGLFKMVPVGFTDVPIEQILDAVAEVAAVPVIVNHYAAAEKGIMLDEMLVSYPKKRAAYMQVLNSVITRSRLTDDIRVDERGLPFIYVTAFVPKTVKDLSPAESN